MRLSSVVQAQCTQLPAASRAHTGFCARGSLCHPLAAREPAQSKRSVSIQSDSPPGAFRRPLLAPEDRPARNPGDFAVTVPPCVFAPSPACIDSNVSWPVASQGPSRGPARTGTRAPPPSPRPCRPGRPPASLRASHGARGQLPVALSLVRGWRPVTAPGPASPPQLSGASPMATRRAPALLS